MKQLVHANESSTTTALPAGLEAHLQHPGQPFINTALQVLPSTEPDDRRRRSPQHRTILVSAASPRSLPWASRCCDRAAAEICAPLPVIPSSGDSCGVRRATGDRNNRASAGVAGAACFRVTPLWPVRRLFWWFLKALFIGWVVARASVLGCLDRL